MTLHFSSSLFPAVVLNEAQSSHTSTAAEVRLPTVSEMMKDQPGQGFLFTARQMSVFKVVETSPRPVPDIEQLLKVLEEHYERVSNSVCHVQSEIFDYPWNSDLRAVEASGPSAFEQAREWLLNNRLFAPDSKTFSGLIETGLFRRSLRALSDFFDGVGNPDQTVLFERGCIQMNRVCAHIMKAPAFLRELANELRTAVNVDGTGFSMQSLRRRLSGEEGFGLIFHPISEVANRFETAAGWIEEGGEDSMDYTVEPLLPSVKLLHEALNNL